MVSYTNASYIQEYIYRQGIISYDSLYVEEEKNIYVDASYHLLSVHASCIYYMKFVHAVQPNFLKEIIGFLF